jgi:hypothetical protein
MPGRGALNFNTTSTTAQSLILLHTREILQPPFEYPSLWEPSGVVFKIGGNNGGQILLLLDDLLP